MANIYVRSTDGNNADNGSTWALAKLDLAGAAGIDAAGDDIYISDNHAESTAAGITPVFANNAASPVKLLSANDAAEPPTALLAGAKVTTTGTSSITLSGSIYVWGLTFECGSGAVNANLTLNPNSTDNARQQYEDCIFRQVATGASTNMQINGTASSNNNANWTRFKNCTIKFARASVGIQNWGEFVWDGGSIESGSTALTGVLFVAPTSGRPSRVEVAGVDFSNIGSAVTFFNAAGAAFQLGTLRNCKLPASWSGSLASGTWNVQGRFSMYNCDNGDTNWRLWIEEYAGTITDETTVVKTGGASDGTTPIAWKLITRSTANEYTSRLTTDDIAVWIETVGSPITLTLDFTHDSATNLQDDEIWANVEYLGTSGFPLSLSASCRRASVLTTPADHDASSATWANSGMTNPNEQKLEVTFTPLEKGVAFVRVFLAKPSYTVFLDPLPVLS